jgi:hypothetical protein
MRKLSEQEIEVLQRLIVNEGWMPVREHFGVSCYSATYEIDNIKYVIHKEGSDVEGWEID